MSKKQILVLFVCSLVPWTVGNGLLPLLPVYATHLGADPATAGYYLAFSYLALAVGAVAAGWLSDRLQRHKMPLILAGLTGIPITWLMGRAGFVINLGRSLLMTDLGFGALEISSTGAVSGVVAMPLPFLMGWLSDRMGRRIFLYLGYLAGAAGLVMFVMSTSLWHFFSVSVLQAILMGVNGTIGNAMVTDVVPQESLGRGLALFGATGWIGGVLGFAGTGYALQNLGTVPTFILATSLPLIAIVLLIPIRSEM